MDGSDRLDYGVIQEKSLKNPKGLREEKSLKLQRLKTSNTTIGKKVA